MNMYSLHEEMKNLELSVDKEVKGPIKNDTPTESSNRRMVLRPRKRSLTFSEVNGNNNDDQLVNFYNVENKKPKLQITSKKRHSHLETIFEEPVIKKNGSVMLIGMSKVNRTITFSKFISKAKQNKRKAQIKKYKVGTKNKSKNYKLSLKDVEHKLDEMDVTANVIT